MNKIVFLCPGQGSQYRGMGVELYENFESFRNTIDEMEEILPERNMKYLLFHASDEDLKKTENAQIAIYTISVALGKLLIENGIYPYACAGLSLGEFSALTISGCMSIEDGLRLVEQRSILMSQTIQNGGMLAVLGVSSELVQELICKSCLDVQIANYNSNRQTIVSGSKDLLKDFEHYCEEDGRAQTVELAVSGPFHSKYYTETGRQFIQYLNKVQWKPGDSSIKVYRNYDAQVYDNDYEKFLSMQMYSPVKWMQTIVNMVDFGAEVFIEVGPGKSLASINKGINRHLPVFSSDNVESINKIIDKLKESGG